MPLHARQCIILKSGNPVVLILFVNGPNIELTTDASTSGVDKSIEEPGILINLCCCSEKVGLGYTNQSTLKHVKDITQACFEMFQSCWCKTHFFIVNTE
jgi:hypothetical protein